MQLCPLPRCDTDNQDRAKYCKRCNRSLQGLLGRDALLKGRYRIKRVLGCGGFGVVYLAEDEKRAGGLVAVKTLQQLQHRRAFERECRLLLKLPRHSNLPRAQEEFVDERGLPYVVMNYVDGVESSDRVPMREGEALRLFQGLLAAVEHLHNQKVIHRDIKPHNVRIKPGGIPVLVDLGLAKELTGESSSMAAHTSHYASPEQIDRKRTDERSDIYSLGATLHCWLCGQPPAAADGRRERLRLGQPDIPSVQTWMPELSQRTAEVVTKCVDLDPQQRYQSVVELRHALFPEEQRGRIRKEPRTSGWRKNVRPLQPRSTVQPMPEKRSFSGLLRTTVVALIVTTGVALGIIAGTVIPGGTNQEHSDQPATGRIGGSDAPSPDTRQHELVRQLRRKLVEKAPEIREVAMKYGRSQAYEKTTNPHGSSSDPRTRSYLKRWTAQALNRAFKEAHVLPADGGLDYETYRETLRTDGIGLVAQVYAAVDVGRQEKVLRLQAEERAAVRATPRGVDRRTWQNEVERNRQWNKIPSI